MSMAGRMILLTTDTPHHLYYARMVSQRYPWKAIVLERRRLKAPFDTFHPYEDLQASHERGTLLGDSPAWGDLAPLIHVESANDDQSVSELRGLSPEVILVFGTGKLKPPVIDAASVACLNLHGGNPEAYRGLDCHLWSIYHGDFDALVTTLHHVQADLDTGAIVGQSRIPLPRGSRLFELRALNTKVCVDITLSALDSLAQTGHFASHRQNQLGRYYSFMPTVLKELCVQKFEKHTASL